MRLTLAITLLLMSGCATVQYATAPPSGTAVAATPEVADLAPRIAELAAKLSSLGPGTDPAEARQLAKTAIYHSLQLVEEYRLTRPPLAHNMLVNAGLRPRGLCIHWTEDLLSKLHQLGTQSFDLWWGVATRATPFHVEHSTVVVTARDAPFASGIVLDGWRNSGWLYWSPVENDKYEWNVMGNYITGTGLTITKASVD